MMRSRVRADLDGQETNLHSRMIWFVTGCSRGLGRCLAEELLKDSHSVVLAVRDTNAVSDLLAAHTETAHAVTLDLNKPSDIPAAIDSAHKWFGHIDVLVNNAGYALLGAVEEISINDARNLMETNYFGPVGLIQAALPMMRQRKSGHIINISSIGGFAALPSCGQYSATKFALEGMSEALHQEVSDLGIKVTIVEPNGVRTDFLSDRSLRISGTAIPDYDRSRGAQIAKFNAANGSQPSDPVLGARAIMKLAEAKTPPLRFVFAAAGIERVRAKLSEVEKDLSDWKDLSLSVTFQLGSSK
ncbi:oxidoreductase [Thalassospira sp.]|uniref:oxidoreductase n=1 Tax=Thalassospira sp. TaxID=1912094 RepID=UPI003AA7DB9B